jgi:hypothetical protein
MPKLSLTSLGLTRLRLCVHFDSCHTPAHHDHCGGRGCQVLLHVIGKCSPNSNRVRSLKDVAVFVVSHSIASFLASSPQSGRPIRNDASSDTMISSRRVNISTVVRYRRRPLHCACTRPHRQSLTSTGNRTNRNRLESRPHTALHEGREACIRKTST